MRSDDGEDGEDGEDGDDGDDGEDGEDGDDGDDEDEDDEVHIQLFLCVATMPSGNISAKVHRRLPHQ